MASRIFFGLFKFSPFFARPFQPPRMLHTFPAVSSRDKFSLTRKKRRYRTLNKTSLKKMLDRPSNTVFQLDPLKGQYAPIVPDTVRQDSRASVLQQALTKILSCNDLDDRLRSYQVEITKVKIARDLGNATVYWHTDLATDEDKVLHVQELLERNKDLIRKLLPVYCQLNRCPQLHFAREKKARYISDVEALLERADYGDNYHSQPKTVPEDFFKSPYTDR